MTTESDARVVELVRALGGRLLADDAALRELVPGATVLEIYTALTAAREVVDERLRVLEPAARAERIQQLGGVN